MAIALARRIAFVALLASMLGAADTDPLQRVDFDAWKARLASYRPEIVVVDMWATWCSSCLTRFPKMVDLSRRYASQGVQFVSLSLDDRDDVQALAAARTFLRKQQAPFDHYLMDERMNVAFDKLKLLGIPAVVIYGRDGAEVARLTGDNPNDQFDERDVEAAIERLLGNLRPAA
jgi:thiol-disulfide isomerase/thioredoxin